jgi:hypothetical protein
VTTGTYMVKVELRGAEEEEEGLLRGAEEGN